jgi:alpha-glucosidase
VTNRGVDWKRVRFPSGKWVDFHTGAIIEGPANMRVDAPLNKMPVYVRAGAPIPMWKAARSTKFIDRLYLRVECYPAGQAETLLYEDDGETKDYISGRFARIALSTREEKEKGRRLFARGATEGDYSVPGREVEVVFVGCDSRPREVRLRVNGKTESLKWKESRTRGEIAVKVADSDGGFEVELVQ